jgi:hypothetical protein
MDTITSLARKSGIPRRTAQYWHDKGVIIPETTDPVGYSKNELILARLLGTLALSKPTLSTVQLLSNVFRLCIAQDGSVPGDVASAFAAAKAGKQAFLGLSLELMSDGESLWPWTFGATDEAEMQAKLLGRLKQRPHLAVNVIDLNYCFDLSVQVGVIFLGE